MQHETNGILDSVTFRLIKFEYYLQVRRITTSIKPKESKIEYNVKEPVIRLFGRVTDSIDICVHIHKFYPYFFVCVDSISNENLMEWVSRLEKGIERFLREKEANKEAIPFKYIQSLQLVRGKSIYGFHMDEQSFLRISLYNPLDVVTVAREIADGKLPTPEDQSHKYNYKLKFLTDFDVTVFGFTTVTNLTLRPHLNDPSYYTTDPSMRRHSLCSIEGDIHIKDLLVKRHDDSEYLIPSFLMLKKKVERLFGIQPSASLTQNRVPKEDCCGSGMGKAQFELYARDILRQNGISVDDNKTNIDDESDIERVNESVLSDDVVFPHEEGNSLTKLIPSSEPKDLEEFSVHSVRSGRLSSLELSKRLDSSVASQLLGYTKQEKSQSEASQFESLPQKRIHSNLTDSVAKKTEWKQLFSEGSTFYHRYCYSIKVPQRDPSNLKLLMQSYHLPDCHYDNILVTKEFNTLEIISRYFGNEDSGLHSNRLQFWQDIIEPPQILGYRRFLYNIQPPRMKKAQVAVNNCDVSEIQSSLNASVVINSSVTQQSESDTPLPSLRLMSIELLCDCKGTHKPNPESDSILGIFYSFSSTDHHNNDKTPIYSGIIYNSLAFSCTFPPYLMRSFQAYSFVSSEKELILSLINTVISFNPDFLVEYEMQRDSIGYLIDRCEHLDIPILFLLSRCPFSVIHQDIHQNSNISNHFFVDPSCNEYQYDGNADFFHWKSDTNGVLNINPANTRYNQQKASTISMNGRYVLSLFRILRKNGFHSGNNNDFCAVMGTIFGITVPRYENHVLLKIMNSSHSIDSGILYLRKKAFYSLHILYHTHLLNRFIESCTIQGIDLTDELTRGSQYKIENILLRINNSDAYSMICLNATEHQLSLQPPAVSIPLVMEPYSDLYTDPMIIMDFQSLYPSVMIAYNICFSTCLGNINKKTGVGMYDGTGFDIHYRAGLREIEAAYKGGFHVSPTGTVFVDKNVREGIIVKMVSELLRIRVLIKNVLKTNQNHPLYDHYKLILDANQLALKGIVNTTYGYINAGFSGRMPNAQIGDSIVEYARTILTASINYVIKNYPSVKIVYADTDSMFILCKGFSRHDAFALGKQLEEEISGLFPSPIMLKFEKVYHPCIMVTKKRYTGYCYMREDAQPFVEGKGIEMIRSDQCEYIRQLSEAFLEKIFTSSSLEDVQLFVQNEFRKILTGNIDIPDFVLWREVKLGSYKLKETNTTDQALHEGESDYQKLIANNSSLPPAAIVSIKRILEDERDIPLYKERVPYLVVYGAPGSRLKDQVISPFDLIQSFDPIRINGLYYIQKHVIPVLNRLSMLFGVDVEKWYHAMSDIPMTPSFMIPSKLLAKRQASDSTVVEREPDKAPPKDHGIDNYYASNVCFSCGRVSVGDEIVCSRCQQFPDKLLTTITWHLHDVERRLKAIKRRCQQCSGLTDIEDYQCMNISCYHTFEWQQLLRESRYYHFLYDYIKQFVP